MRAAALRAAAALVRRRSGSTPADPAHVFSRPLASAPTGGSGDEDGGADRPCTPWVRTVVSGVDLMRNPK